MLGVRGRETDLVPRIRWKGVRRPWRDVEEVAMRWYCIHVLLSFRYGAVGRRFYVGMLDYWSFRKKGQIWVLQITTRQDTPLVRCKVVRMRHGRI
jgi:hypothetical protein